MLKEFSIENWILGGIGFILIFTLGCYMWFQNEMASIEQHSTNRDVEAQHLERPSETKQVETPQIEQADTVEPDTSEEDNSVSKDAADIISNANGTQQKDGERAKQTVYVLSRKLLPTTGAKLLSLDM